MSGFRVPYPKFGAGIGLARMRAIAAIAGLDLAFWPAKSVHIAGSNGKGSVTLVLDAILRQALPRVGRYMSPHYFRINERFAIDGEEVSDEALGAAWTRIERAAATYAARAPNDQLGGFEFLTLVCWALFEAADVSFAVMECGIGARYDATRAAGGAQWAALVSLDLEHSNLLGATLEQIAYDKLDAAAPGGRVIIGAGCASLRERIEAYCTIRGVAAEFVGKWRETDGELQILLDPGVSRDPGNTADPEESRSLGPDLRRGRNGQRAARCALPLAGAHQRANAALAARLAEDILRARGVAPDERIAAIEQGLANVKCPGRLETIETSPRIVVDVGHTPAAVRCAHEAFFELIGAEPAILVCGASIDKDASDIIAALAPRFALAVATCAQHKGRPASEIAALLRATRPDLEVLIADDVARAYAGASALARERSAAVLAAGGLFLAIEFKAVHQGLDPAALDFF